MYGKEEIQKKFQKCLIFAQDRNDLEEELKCTLTRFKSYSLDNKGTIL